MSAKNELQYDQRTIERKIQRGLVTRKEYDQYLASLKDVSDKAVPLFSEEEEKVDEE
jgi:hypothetical protein